MKSYAYPSKGTSSQVDDYEAITEFDIQPPEHRELLQALALQILRNGEQSKLLAQDPDLGAVTETILGRSNFISENDPLAREIISETVMQECERVRKIAQRLTETLKKNPRRRIHVRDAQGVAFIRQALEGQGDAELRSVLRGKTFISDDPEIQKELKQLKSEYLGRGIVSDETLIEQPDGRILVLNLQGVQELEEQLSAPAHDRRHLRDKILYTKNPQVKAALEAMVQRLRAKPKLQEEAHMARQEARRAAGLQELQKARTEIQKEEKESGLVASTIGKVRGLFRAWGK